MTDPRQAAIELMQDAAHGDQSPYFPLALDVMLSDEGEELLIELLMGKGSVIPAGHRPLPEWYPILGKAFGRLPAEEDAK